MDEAIRFCFYLGAAGRSAVAGDHDDRELPRRTARRRSASSFDDRKDCFGVVGHWSGFFFRRISTSGRPDLASGAGWRHTRCVSRCAGGGALGI